jgi:hypothetical protein
MPGMGFRARPAGVVEGPIDEGTLNLPNDYRRARALTFLGAALGAEVQPVIDVDPMVNDS